MREIRKAQLEEVKSQLHSSESDLSYQIRQVIAGIYSDENLKKELQEIELKIKQGVSRKEIFCLLDKTIGGIR